MRRALGACCDAGDAGPGSEELRTALAALAAAHADLEARCAPLPVRQLLETHT